MMFGEFGGGGGGEFPGAWPGGIALAGLSATQARLLWALRRMALMQPLGRARCHAVHIALQQDFGDAGQGIEHLLRCWLVALSRHAARRVVIGEPACPMLMPDEARLLLALRLAVRDPEAAAMALVPLAGGAGGLAIVPLLAAVAGLAEIS